MTLFSCNLAQVVLESTVHSFENLQALLMPVIDLSQKREIVRGILVEHIVLDENHLELLHIEPSIHLYGAFINQINDRALL